MECRIIIKIRKIFVLAGMAFLCICMSHSLTFAKDRMKVVEKYTGESEITLYVKGIQRDLENITVQVGTAVCDSVEKSTLAKAKQQVRTLVMLDNSQSIPKKDRKLISEILSQIISDRTAQEEVAIAVLNKDIEYLTDYTSDENTLAAALDQITYRNTKTYLTDVLYDWIFEEYMTQQADIYYRIIVIADGTDNKPIGYTQEEFYSLLKEYPVPIYTIGMRTKENNANLENMFAISRASNADSFLLDDMEQVSDINAQLNTDQNIVKVVIMPEAELLDGNKKAIKIISASGNTLLTEAKMPQIANKMDKATTENAEALEAESVKTDEIKKENTQVEDLKEKQAENEKEKKNRLLVFAGSAVLTVLLVLAVILAIRKKTKHAVQETGQTDLHSKEKEPDAYSDKNRHSSEKEDHTEMVDSDDFQNGDQTVVFWDSQASYHVILSDIKLAEKSVGFPLKNTVVIGRKQDTCDVVLDYDRTVSGRHCRLTVRDGRFYITDLKSSNGTYINDRRVMSEMEIVSGNILKLGKLELKFEVG